MDDKQLNDMAHELWAVSQCPPGTGIEDAVSRIVDIIKPEFERLERRNQIKDNTIRALENKLNGKSDD